MEVNLLVIMIFLILVIIDFTYQTTSRIIFNDFSNLTDEQTLYMAYNYTKTFFSQNEPIPVKIPTTLVFDHNSPLKAFVDEDKINPSLSDYDLPTEFDFHFYPQDDILAPLYQHELSQQKQQKMKIVLGKIKDPHMVDKDHMKEMLESVFTLPRHSERNSTLTDSIGQYIMRKFGRLGLLTGTQVFHPSQFHDMFWEPGATIDAGSNIIGIYPGDNFYTSEDKILVVGAHWDTTGFTDGYNDNGSGLAAMIEVVRGLIQSECRLKYSIIFVAFDKEEVGSQGSHEFVREFLVPEFFKGEKWPEFQGAIVLDTIMNFNQTENSEFLPNEWRQKIPESTFEEIEENDFRGDFISLISRSEPEKFLASTLEKHWNNLYKEDDFKIFVTNEPKKFKFRRFAVELPASMPSLMTLTEYIHFLRSDHARFWYSNQTNYQLSLKSVLMTDTGPYRGLMKNCYHRDCDSFRLMGKTGFANYEFLSMTVQTIIDTVTELSGATCHASKRARKVKESYKDVTFIDQNDIGRSTGGSCGVFFSNSAAVLLTATAFLIKFMIYEEHGNMQ